MRLLEERLRHRGAAAVEFAIVLPLLLTIVCGAIDWGYYFFTREVVVNASREGARVGTLLGKTAADAKQAAQEYLNDALPKPETATITDGASCPATSSCVRVEYPSGSITGLLSPFIPSSIVAYAEMRK